MDYKIHSTMNFSRIEEIQWLVKSEWWCLKYITFTAFLGEWGFSCKASFQHLYWDSTLCVEYLIIPSYSHEYFHLCRNLKCHQEEESLLHP